MKAETVADIVKTYKESGEDIKKLSRLLEDFNLQIVETDSSSCTPAENPLTVSPHPKYIRELIEEGFIDSDLKVLTNLDDVAIALQRKLRNRITKYHLQTFKNPQTGKEYSPSARERAVTASKDEFYHRTKNPQ